MLPITTRVLTPAQFGLVYLLASVFEVVNILISEGTTAGLLKFYFAARTAEERREVVTGTFGFLVLQGLLGGLLVALAAPVIHQRLLHGQGSPAMVYVVAATFVAGSLAPVPLAVMQAEQRAGLVSALSITQFGLQLACNVAFLLALGLGPIGLQLSTLLAFVIVGAVATGWLLRHMRPRWRWTTAVRQRRFGVPYQISAAAVFLLNSGDRFVLQATQTADVTGLYILGYQFGFLMYSVSASPFLQAWVPTAFQRSADPRPKRDEYFAGGLFALTGLMMLACVGVVAFAKPVVRLVSRPEFEAAADLVAPIVLAYAFNGWYTIFRLQADISGRTRAVPVVNWTGAAVAVAGYLLLIPRFAAWGGACATLIAFMVRTVHMYVLGQRAMPVDWRLRRPAAVVALACALCAVTLWLRPVTFGGMVVAGLLLVATFVTACWFAVLTTNERLHTLGVANKLRARLPGRLAPRPG
jgi:O-antigen/teichoic acid export membrane protein